MCSTYQETSRRTAKGGGRRPLLGHTMFAPLNLWTMHDVPDLQHHLEPLTHSHPEDNLVPKFGMQHHDSPPISMPTPAQCTKKLAEEQLEVDFINCTSLLPCSLTYILILHLIIKLLMSQAWKYLTRASMNLVYLLLF